MLGEIIIKFIFPSKIEVIFLFYLEIFILLHFSCVLFFDHMKNLKNILSSCQRKILKSIYEVFYRSILSVFILSVLRKVFQDFLRSLQR